MSATQVDLSLAKPGDECLRRDGTVVPFEGPTPKGRLDLDEFEFFAGERAYRQDGTWHAHRKPLDIDIVRVERDGKVITPAPAFPNAGPGQFREDLINAAEFVDNAGANELAGRLRAWAETEPAPAKPAEEVGEYAYASKQATSCAGCLEHKHTPLRRDELGGYVCLTCIDRELDNLQTWKAEAQKQFTEKERIAAELDAAVAHHERNMKSIDLALGEPRYDDGCLLDAFLRRISELQGPPVRDLSVSGELPGDAPAAVIQGPGKYRTEGYRLSDINKDAWVATVESVNDEWAFGTFPGNSYIHAWSRKTGENRGGANHSLNITGPYVEPPPKPVLTIEDERHDRGWVYAWTRFDRRSFPEVEGISPTSNTEDVGEMVRMGRHVYVHENGPLVVAESDWPRVQELVAKVNAENGKAGE